MKNRSSINHSLFLFFVLVSVIVPIIVYIYYGSIYCVLSLIVLLGITVYFYSKTNKFKCPVCGYEFEVSAFKILCSHHAREFRKLKCPKCKKIVLATEIPKK